MKKSVKILGSNFYLRLPVEGDYKYFVKWFSDPEIMRYFAAYFWQVSPKDLRRYFKDLIAGKTDEFFFVINDKAGAVIGGVGADELNPIVKSGEFWVLIGNKDYQGRGIGKEATKLFCQYFFGQKKYNRLELEVSCFFEKGIKMYQDVGFKKEGVRREADFSVVANQYEDQLAMSILRKDWLS